MSSSRFRDLPASAQAALCDQMVESRLVLPLVEETIRSLSGGNIRSEFTTLLMLALIGQQKFEQAIEVVGGRRVDPKLLHLPEAFNFAIALWGASNRVPTDCFQRVVELIPQRRDITGRNVWQCFAIAHWASKNLTAAHEFLNEAEAIARRDNTETFTCWRYLRVSGEQFLADLPSVRSMIEGKDVLPAVFSSSG